VLQCVAVCCSVYTHFFSLSLLLYGNCEFCFLRNDSQQSARYSTFESDCLYTHILNLKKLFFENMCIYMSAHYSNIASDCLCIHKFSKKLSLRTCVYVYIYQHAPRLSKGSVYVYTYSPKSSLLRICVYIYICVLACYSTFESDCLCIHKFSRYVQMYVYIKCMYIYIFRCMYM